LQPAFFIGSAMDELGADPGDVGTGCEFGTKLDYDHARGCNGRGVAPVPCRSPLAGKGSKESLSKISIDHRVIYVILLQTPIPDASALSRMKEP
jgi:hypothetical protein